jgi:hypothetical protein
VERFAALMLSPAAFATAASRSDIVAFTAASSSARPITTATTTPITITHAAAG